MDRVKAETQLQKAKTQSHSSYQCPSCNLVANMRNASNALLLLYCNLAAHLTKEYLKCFIGTMSLHKRKMKQTQQKFPINSTNSPNLAKIFKYAFIVNGALNGLDVSLWKETVISDLNVSWFFAYTVFISIHYFTFNTPQILQILQQWKQTLIFKAEKN